MKAEKVKDWFKLDKVRVLELLDFYKFENIKTYASEVRFSFNSNEKTPSNSLKFDSLAYKNYKTDERGDIISLIQAKNGWGFIQALKQLYSHAGMIPTEKKLDIVLPFGGFYKNITRCEDNQVELEIIDDGELEVYDKTQFKLFKDDGISYSTQVEFGLRYDPETSRIVIPIYSEEGLVGMLGRFNGYDADVLKYLPIIAYPKSQVLFGYVENYQHLVSSDRIYVAESEKSVMQAYDMGVRNVVAVGGSSISPVHKKLLYSLNPKEIVVCYDKGFLKSQAEKELQSRLEVVSEDNIANVQSEKIESKVTSLKMSNSFSDVKIGYIWDKDNVLKDKESLFDNGKDVAYKLMEDIVWIED